MAEDFCAPSEARHEETKENGGHSHLARSGLRGSSPCGPVQGKPKGKIKKRKLTALAAILAAAICGGLLFYDVSTREAWPEGAGEGQPGNADEVRPEGAGKAKTSSQSPLLVAHRGAPQEDPENSIAGFKRAAEEGAQFIEFDLVLSKDGVIFISHDDNLMRTTGRNIYVSRTDSRELDEVTLRNGEKLPRLNELFGNLKDSLFYVIETKDIGGEKSRLMDRELIESIREYRLQSRVILSSQSLDSLKTVHEAFRSIPCMYISHRGTRGSPIEQIRSLPHWIDAVSISKDMVTLGTIATAHMRGVQVGLFTIRNEKDMKMALKYRPEIIFTDDMAGAMKYLEKHETLNSSH